MPTDLRAKKVTSEWASPIAFNEPNLIVPVQFCTIGLLITLIVMFYFPALGAIIEEYNQF